MELSKDLCNIAEHNLKKVMPDGTKWNIFNCDAAIWEGYDEYNIFYIYNSFPKKVMEEVRDKITESIKRKRRKVTIWYLCPEFPEVFLRDNVHYEFIKRGSFLQLNHGMYVFISK